MEYSNEILVKIARKELIEKLDSVENMKYWQRGLISSEVIEGNPGEESTQMRLKYMMGKREVILTETIIKRNFPEEFHANYDSKGVHNIQKNYFYKVDDNTTKWVSETVFQFSSFTMKLMAWVMPGMFKKQSMKYLIDFKNFAEKGTSVLDA